MLPQISKSVREVDTSLSFHFPWNLWRHRLDAVCALILIAYGALIDSIATSFLQMRQLIFQYSVYCGDLI